MGPSPHPPSLVGSGVDRPGTIENMGTQEHFRWGAGTSAYQIEGAWSTDGKGESIWDRFLHERPAMTSGDSACDHYRRLDEDLDLLADIGVNAYRFSTAWTRIIPDGDGDVNPAGFAFYDRLIDGLIARGIEPWPTLYHWDLPQALQNAGGWPSRESVGWFARYTSVMVDHFGDRVSHWITVNEPWVSSFLGHADGVFAPGSHSWRDALLAAHHQLLAHGEAARIIHSRDRNSSVGIALDCRPAVPLTDDPADVAATDHFDGFRNRWFFDPVFGKGYPADMVTAYESTGRLPDNMVQPGDMDSIAEPIEFCGVNYYTSIGIDASTAEDDQAEGPVGPSGADGYTEMGWKIDPDALGGFVRRIHAEWQPDSIVITENGASFSDGVGADGLVHDIRRIDYLSSHIDQVESLRADGVPVDGYFVWSLLDNLEWTSGFDQRFGLIHVDHTTQRRTIKDSGYWYRDRIARGMGTLRVDESGR